MLHRAVLFCSFFASAAFASQPAQVWEWRTSDVPAGKHVWDQVLGDAQGNIVMAGGDQVVVLDSSGHQIGGFKGWAKDHEFAAIGPELSPSGYLAASYSFVNTPQDAPLITFINPMNGYVERKFYRRTSEALSPDIIAPVSDDTTMVLSGYPAYGGTLFSMNFDSYLGEANSKDQCRHNGTNLHRNSNGQWFVFCDSSVVFINSDGTVTADSVVDFQPAFPNSRVSFDSKVMGGIAGNPYVAQVTVFPPESEGANSYKALVYFSREKKVLSVQPVTKAGNSQHDYETVLVASNGSDSLLDLGDNDGADPTGNSDYLQLISRDLKTKTTFQEDAYANGGGRFSPDGKWLVVNTYTIPSHLHGTLIWLRMDKSESYRWVYPLAAGQPGADPHPWDDGFYQDANYLSVDNHGTVTFAAADGVIRKVALNGAQ